jgi:hypothetical protein
MSVCRLDRGIKAAFERLYYTTLCPYIFSHSKFFGALKLSFSSIDDGTMVDRHYQVRQLSRVENSIDGLDTDALLLMDLRPPLISSCSTFSETMSLHEKMFHLI